MYETPVLPTPLPTPPPTPRVLAFQPSWSRSPLLTLAQPRRSRYHMMQNETLVVRFAPEDTALETSAKLAQIARDSLLLEWGADIMVRSHDWQARPGKTALYWAQLMGRYDVSRLLLEHHGHGPRKTIKKTRIKKQTRPRRPS